MASDIKLVFHQSTTLIFIRVLYKACLIANALSRHHMANLDNAYKVRWIHSKM